MRVDLSDIPGAFFLPRPAWDVIQTWLNSHLEDAERRQAWTEVVHQWLAILGPALDGAYRAHVGREVILLTTSQDAERIRALLDFAESGIAAIRKQFGALAARDWHGPLPLLEFAHHDHYYRYLSQFYPEGEYGGSGGVCFQEGYVHIGLAPAELSPLQLTLAHELTHACLSHLRLPVWLEEGATQFMEGVLHSQGRFQPEEEVLREVRRFWRVEGLQDFWWGQGFQCPDDRQRNSYMLARLLFHLLTTDHGRAFEEFLSQARREDAGEWAARRVLKRGLSELASTFLGVGNWTPLPPSPQHFGERGAFHLQHGRLDEALADLEEVLRLEPHSVWALTHKATVLYRRQQYAQAVAVYEEALKCKEHDLAANNALAWLLATCPDDTIRDGQRALELALRACEPKGYSEANSLDTLAAAYAEVGDFEEARRWQKAAVRVVAPEDRADYQSRAKLYRQGQPFREVPTADGSPRSGEEPLRDA